MRTPLSTNAINNLFAIWHAYSLRLVLFISAAIFFITIENVYAKDTLQKQAKNLVSQKEESDISSRNSQINDNDLKAFLKRNIHSSGAIADKFDAEVWLFNMAKRMERFGITNKTEQLTILKAVYFEASQSNLQPDIVLAVIAIESSFNQYAISRVGAQGLMQVMPFWKKEIGRNQDNLTNIETNIRYGCKILQYYLQRENGNLAKALARYNGSVGKTHYAEKVLQEWEQYWRSGRI